MCFGAAGGKECVIFMKKILLFLSIFALIFNLCGCSNKKNTTDTKKEKTVETTKKEENNKEEAEKSKDPIQQEENKDNKPTENTTIDEHKEDNTSQQKNTVSVQYQVTPLSSGRTYTNRQSLISICYDIKDPYNQRGLSTNSYNFSFGAAKEGKPHQITIDNQKRFDSYQTNALAWDNKTQNKVLYLTFDCGYEYKNLTSQILDILKEKQVPASFFCTMEYLNDAPTTVARMINEGHIVGNHTVHHPSNCATLSRETFAKEILGVHNALRVRFGYDSHYFRFPTGTYSQDAIDLVNSVGYRSVFWSIAHADWDPDNQPGVDTSFETVTSRLHPGAVILLHSTSPDNVAILRRFIDYARNNGYSFQSLNQYQYWK